MPDMKLSEAITYCASIERLIGDVYDSFASRWPDPPIAGLWRGLAQEERIHGAMLDDAARMPAAERVDPSFDAAKLEALRQSVANRMASATTTLDQALTTALDLEGLELDNIYRRLFALTTDDSRMSSVFRSALSQFGQHETRILSAIESYSRDPILLARASRERQHLVLEPSGRGAAE
jgi:rubrerythrin